MATEVEELVDSFCEESLKNFWPNIGVKPIEDTAATDDRRLFQRLYCAVVASGFNPAEAPTAAMAHLKALRSAEGEQPTDDLTGLRARLAEAESRCEALTRELREQWAAYQSSLDAADAIIHALCDERAERRSKLREVAHDLAMMGNKAHLYFGLIGTPRVEREPPKPPKRVLPVGHVPERLEVGMVLRSHTGGLVNVERVAGRNAFGDGRALDATNNWWPLAAPFEVPNE